LEAMTYVNASKLLHDYGKRIKELRCIYGISKLLENPDVSLEEILQKTVNLLPSAWRYPDIACARIVFEKREFKTKNFRETIWKQSADIKIHGKRVGAVEVYYLEQNPTLDEGPFSKEERDLIEAAAESLGKFAERRKAEEALQESEKKYRELADLLPQAVYEMDERGNLTFTNRKGFESYGYTREDFEKGLNALQMFIPEDRDRVRNNIQRILSGEKLVGNEYTARRKDGSTFPVIIYSSPIIRENKPTGLRGIIVDITDRKRMQEELLKAERLAAIGEVATMVGHDLRNPLTGIATAAYYLKMRLGSKMDKKMEEMLELIDKDIEYSNKIISDLLEYSREIRLELVETTPKSIVEDSLTLVKVSQNIQILDFTGSEPRINVDVQKMKRVFVNIIKNSIDAMPEGGKLTIKSKESGDSVEIAFADTGAGMTGEIMEKLWMPLFTTKAKGMGLGLSICKRIVEAHGGSIFVNSTVGKGTTFTVTLPIKPKIEGGEKTWANIPGSLLSTTTKA